VQHEPILRIRPLKSQRSAGALRLGYLPIMEKSNAFGYLDQFDKVAIIDADVFIRDDAPSIFDQLGEADFAGVIERDMPLTDTHKRTVATYSEGQYRPLTDVDWQWNNGAAFYNMGLMLLGKGILQYMESPRELIERPEHERFVNGEGHWRWSTDQTLLNYWVKKSGMKAQNLDWRWNALYGAVRPDAIKEAYFVHFFLAAKMEQKGAEIPGIIKGL
jgi:hypothetical protein